MVYQINIRAHCLRSIISEDVTDFSLQVRDILFSKGGSTREGLLYKADSTRHADGLFFPLEKDILLNAAAKSAKF
jgi:hypothetical protein